jgi:hypothetical protein
MFDDFGSPSMPSVPPATPPPPPPPLPPLAQTVTAPADEAQAEARKDVRRRTREQNVYTSPLGVVTPGRNVSRKTLLGT